MAWLWEVPQAMELKGLGWCCGYLAGSGRGRGILMQSSADATPFSFPQHTS